MTIDRQNNKKRIEDCIRVLEEEFPDFSFWLKEDLSKDKLGINSYVVSIKRNDDGKKKQWFPRKIAIYFIMRRGNRSVTVVIVNGSTLYPLFIDDGKGSEEKCPKYLDQILRAEIRYICSNRSSIKEEESEEAGMEMIIESPNEQDKESDPER